MIGNVNVNKFDEVVEVSNNMTLSIAHSIKTKPALINRQKTTFDLIPKHLVACPFLRKKGICLKGSRCDFSQNPVKLALIKILISI